jgi:hypothetical protein
MNEGPTTGFITEFDDAKRAQLADLTDWDYLRHMSDAEAEQNALDDPDNPPLSDAELAQMQWVDPKQQSAASSPADS